MEPLREYLEDRSRVGPAPEGAFTGSAGGSACGDLARVSVSVCDGDIGAVSFDSEGCAATRAACACVAELAEGGPVLDAARIDPDRVAEELGGLTPPRRHAAVLACDALHRALSSAASSEVALARAPEGRDRVMVALSGGVDSAVAALTERERGADVVAVTVKLWADPRTDGSRACCSPEAVLGARSLAHSLGIPHLTLDLESRFRERVVDEFIGGYAAGRTPNPCVLCNGEVRIGAMIGLAERAGASALVTGHYARIVDDGAGPLLAAGRDRAKDQSYMLAALPTELLSKLRFPLAEMSKPAVREAAARHGLPVARKPESQDLCFLAGRGKRAFLEDHGGLGDREGEVRDRGGRRLGSHRGHHHFTVGQRRGIGVSGGEPLYVLATDATANTVTVGTREELGADRVAITDVELHRDGSEVDRVRLRYRSEAVGVSLSASRGRHDRLELELDEPFEGAAPGQAAVMMSGDLVVGHGTIEATAPSPVARHV